MNDPKYVIRDGVLCHISGYPLPDDEPVMLFRGKDPYALQAIYAYITYHICPEHRASAKERLDAFIEFQTTHPDRVRKNCTE